MPAPPRHVDNVGMHPSQDAVTLTGERVTLRPFRSDELEVVWRARLDYPGPGPVPDRKTLARRVTNSGRLVDGWLYFAIESERRLIGEIDARTSRALLPPGMYEIGIDLFDGADRGKGLGSEAVALLLDHMFAERDAERIQASTAVDNAAMRAVLMKLGFRFEGVMRYFMPGEDGRVDFALYAVTRPDWKRRASSEH
jgi:RimJ/RimL family protein N-acetyltransferase